jgi:RNA polymerase sigma-70 factor (ECF subfamily)
MYSSRALLPVASDRGHDDPLEDAALARRVLEGDSAAESALCRRLLPRALAWGLKHVRDEAAAQDLAQQATITLLEALRAGRVEQPERVGAFFLGVCKRTLLGWRSGDRGRQDLLLRFGPALGGVAEIRDTAVDRVKLGGCFDRLAPRARTVLALSFFAERSADEIAAELATSTGNVRVLRHRALEQLLTCMEGKT